MDKKSLISIVLPVYNGSDFLADSIESCINQTYQEWELIIINDCSKDNSYEIALSYAERDKRISVINNDINLKLPASLNKGFSYAKGEYLTWTSHDNRMHPEMLEKFVNYLNDHPDVGLVTANYTAIDEKDVVLYVVEHPDPMLYMPIGNTVCYAFMYRREVIGKIGGYDTDLFLIEDYDYWIRIWLHYKIGKIYESLYFTRVHGNTLTAKRKQEIAQLLYELRLHYFDSFYNSLKSHADIRFKFLLSILTHPENKKEKRKLLKRFVLLEPIGFGAKYLFYFLPKKKVKRILRNISNPN